MLELAACENDCIEKLLDLRIAYLGLREHHTDEVDQSLH